MKSIVFISWHSDKQGIGKKISNCFHDYLCKIFGRDIKVFASDVDIKHKWTDELSKALEQSKYGIVVLTPQALDSAWMPYEFGVLRRYPDQVWCFRFGDVSRDKTPFAYYQNLIFSENEVSSMLDTIARKELADKEIDVEDFNTIQSNIKNLTPKLYADVSEIACHIDPYICNRDFRVKYEDILKNGIDTEASKKITALTAENNSLRTDIQSLKEKNDSLSKENQSLKKEKDSLSRDKQSLQQDNASLQSTIDQLKKDLESASKKQSKTSTTFSSSKYGNVIDLGLPSGTLWADRNIGAKSPEDSGCYFAWGEIEPKTGKSYKYKDNPKTLPSSNDAATQNWDSDWRMPTKEQFDELIENCEWTWKGKGYEVMGKNGNSIYLPAAGWRYEKLEGEGQRGLYWSSSHIDSDDAWILRFDSGSHFSDIRKCYPGFSVRAVWCKK